MLAGIKDSVIGREDAVAQVIVFQELPDIFNRIEFRAGRWQIDNSYIIGDEAFFGRVPGGLIHNKHGMRIISDMQADFFQMPVHGAGVGIRLDQGRADIAFRADSTEDIHAREAFVFRGARPGSLFSPYACDMPLLSHSRFVLPPVLQSFAARMFRQCSSYDGREVFLNVS